ncbi:hypothetical protein PR048_021689 [Dryococelus australis]|uniref:Uncharacterized protein n=1 Tax=Dryococelus australis TaxID=614101 RepID=A0ABQ9GYZ2_9NEOP|nr:hypothetical protein PR048_021689 [Dryococelus australis]
MQYYSEEAKKWVRSILDVPLQLTRPLIWKSLSMASEELEYSPLMLMSPQIGCFNQLQQLTELTPGLQNPVEFVSCHLQQLTELTPGLQNPMEISVYGDIPGTSGLVSSPTETDLVKSI